MPFKPAFKFPATPSARALWFVFQRDRLLLKENEKGRRVPCTEDLAQIKLAPIRSQYLGTLDDRACYAAELPVENQVMNGFQLKGLRETFGQLEEELIWIAGRANQLVDWSRNHQFCGHCGLPTEDKSQERAKFCPACGLVNYPRLSPAVIMAVVKGDRLLLASNKRFKSGFYSVLAGFVEPGETLEECVAREIKEEVGISVKNIRYFGSQPWPFPNSLMVGFLADFAGGEIKADQSEIADAGWFAADNLPSIPPKITIARHLIDWFVGRNQTTKIR
ncbi:NADH pyrophosphatase (EC, decaps 5'-NAD modified RNA [Olavius sp. associated proteobacterium Delta 1]|nr:NADH pyrophosphatase (EC, decaps 5'-NAD modified RNA [Olavius sp. associated proteobacterium Delta 1]